ncbi:MAG: ABC transporter substrate-binding protein [Alphaproteobacteria bacterium]
MRQFLRKTYLILVFQIILGAWMPSAGRAQVMAPEQAQQQPAGKFIQDLGNSAIAVIADKSLTQQQRDDKYHDFLRNAFDLKTIGHFVIASAWNGATPAQQQEYMGLFEKLVVKIYGDRMTFYSGEGFQVKNVHSESDQDFIVSSQVTHPNGSPPTNIDWRVREKDGKFGIVDVIVEGVSQSVTQRQEYSSIIQRDGGKIDGLLDVMRQRIQAPPPSTNTAQ